MATSIDENSLEGDHVGVFAGCEGFAGSLLGNTFGGIGDGIFRDGDSAITLNDGAGSGSGDDLFALLFFGEFIEVGLVVHIADRIYDTQASGRLGTRVDC